MPTGSADCPWRRFLARRSEPTSRCANGQARGATADGQDPSDVRNAFNSPFRPFVLISTSVGQEGLDFHYYAHAIDHLNLPGNPVDLERREGRVHRYKNDSVRKNVATRVLSDPSFDPGADPWPAAFSLVGECEGGCHRGGASRPCWHPEARPALAVQQGAGTARSACRGDKPVPHDDGTAPAVGATRGAQRAGARRAEQDARGDHG